jgi:choice-of-anchor C domain-containing protein
MHTRLIAGLAVLGMTGTAHAAGPNLLINGSFEQSDVPAPNTYDEPGVGSTVITGWTLSGNNVDRVAAPYWQAADGIISLDLIGNNGPVSSGDPTAKLSQTIATTAGQVYTLRWAASANAQFISGQSAYYSVGVDGVETPRFYTVGAEYSDPAYQYNIGVYERDHLTFTAASASTTISFTNAQLNVYAGPVLDDVSLTVGGVPEPASWSLLIAGFGLTGGALRARRTGATAAA